MNQNLVILMNVRCGEMTAFSGKILNWKWDETPNPMMSFFLVEKIDWTPVLIIRLVGDELDVILGKLSDYGVSSVRDMEFFKMFLKVIIDYKGAYLDGKPIDV